jgi:hypothetical protein
MTSRFCPRCRALRNVRVTESRRSVADEDGRTREVIRRMYHCEECHEFIGSEDKGEAGHAHA